MRNTGVSKSLTHSDVLEPMTEQPVDARARRAAAQATKASPMADVAGGRRDAAPVVGGGKIGRNAPCPCGSGKKYKRCCGANV